MTLLESLTQGASFFKSFTSVFYTLQKNLGYYEENHMVIFSFADHALISEHLCVTSNGFILSLLHFKCVHIIFVPLQMGSYYFCHFKWFHIQYDGDRSRTSFKSFFRRWTQVPEWLVGLQSLVLSHLMGSNVTPTPSPTALHLLSVIF